MKNSHVAKLGNRRWAAVHQSHLAGAVVAVLVFAATALLAFAPATTALAGATPTDSCPNAQYRVGPSADLPDCRAYEQVSPVNKSGALMYGITQLSDDGSRALFNAQWLPGAPANQGTSASNPYVSERSPTGWAETQMNPPPIYSASLSYDPSADLTRVVKFAATKDQQVRTQGAFYSRGLDGTFESRSPLLDPVFTNSTSTAADKPYIYTGASKDGSHVTFVRSDTAIFPTDPIPAMARSALYEAVAPRGEAPVLRVVNSDADGAVIGGVCGATLGGSGNTGNLGPTGSARHAISDDGSVIFFGARPGAATSGSPNCKTPTQRIFARRNGSETVQVSESQCTRTAPACAATNSDDLFEGASADGSRVFFSTNRQLTNGDLDTKRDLYMYDFSPPPGQPNLVQVSRGTDEAGATNGNSATVLGVTRLSEDGSRAYFVATGILTTVANATGESATAGASNLYVFQRDAAHPAGRIAFVATLDPGDNSLLTAWSLARTSGLTLDNRTAWAVPMNGDHADGRILVFATKAPLANGDTDTASDIYRYDDGGGTMVRVSSGDGAHDSTINTLHGVISSMSPAQERSVSEDGNTIAFATAGQLVGRDTNGVSDAYRWKNGQGVALVSDGQDATGVDFVVVSSTGDDIAFQTVAPLVGQDSDTNVDLYDARIGGGFPAPLIPPAPCVGQACQGSPTPRLVSSVAASVTFAGPGNVLPGRPDIQRNVTVSKPKTVRGTSALITVKVSERGKIRASGPGLRREARTVKKAGNYRVRVRLSKRAKRTLDRKHRVKVRVTVRFAPTTKGRPLTARVQMTFKSKTAKKKRRRKGSSRSMRRTAVLSSDTPKVR